MLTDARGVPLTLSDSLALEPFERALEAARTFRGDPIAPLDAALAIDPEFAAAYASKALILMTFFERRFATDAIAALDAGARALVRATPREKALAAAARALAEGDWHAGTDRLDRVLVEHPRDLLALQVAHLMDFFRGDALNLRNRVSRVLPHWSTTTPGYSFVVGMHSFGLEECNQYPQAESSGLRALALAPEDCWAVHAVTHVMEMQGRIDEGVAFLEERKADWATLDNGFAFHNWWHLALFHMDRGDFAAALAIYDEVLASAHAMAVSRLDATSLLWRLRLEGADVGTRFEAVADAWEESLAGEGGFYAFNDFHAALAFAATGREQQARRLREALETAAWDRRANGEMTRMVGIDVSEAAFDFCEGRYSRAMERLASVRDISSRLGGSHAQRDIITLTLIEAASRAGQRRIAEHYTAERLVHKPASRWGERIMQRLQQRAPAELV
ncbi:MAG: tetratricopeptide repeat protein [Pseudomonadota bacterium]|nr:tetratricopeptide repeat protein [Pseudomonadota bacterium]